MKKTTIELEEEVKSILEELEKAKSPSVRNKYNSELKNLQNRLEKSKNKEQKRIEKQHRYTNGSDKLRETISKNKINKDPRAKKTEDDVKEATSAVIEKLKENYQFHKFDWKQRLYKKELGEYYKKQFSNNSEVGTNLSCKISHIKPDGGLTYLIGKSGIELLIMVSEAGKQGTNDVREEEGKNKQAKGNAVERKSKNVKEVEIILRNEDCFHYSIFATGCDLEVSNSSIRDRITSMSAQSPFQTDETCPGYDKNLGYGLPYIENIIDNNGHQFPRVNFYIGDFSIEQMTNILYQNCIKMINYYIKKYPHEFN